MRRCRIRDVGKSHVIIEQLLAGARNFREGYHRENSALYKTLAAHGQAPPVMFVSCSDSRYDPERITGSGPGMLYVLRVTGAIVPPREVYTRSLPVAAAIEHGVVHLGVSHIVICGHSDCGAAQLAANSAGIKDRGTAEGGESLGEWIEIVSDAPRRARERLAAQSMDGCRDEDFKRACEEELVKISLENLLTYPSVAERVEAGTLEMHGWRFDISGGEVHVFDFSLGEFEKA